MSPPPALNFSNGDPRVQDILSLLRSHTTSFPETPPIARQSNGRGRYLLTGTTGGFGLNILGQLSLDPSVKKIYALNRWSPRETLLSRQLRALEQRGVLEKCLSATKFQLVEADLSQPNLGLSPALYEEISGSITHIIHNAWLVSFVKPLQHFGECLQGLRNLIDIALSSPFEEPPKFLFVASISMLRNYPGKGHAPEEPYLDPSVAVGMGYAESKWIAEQILMYATEKTDLVTTSVRVGVLCGDRNGYWDPNSLFPLLFKAAPRLHCLFDMEGDGSVAWLPAWEAAGALCRFRHAQELILHLANPKPVPWREIAEVVAEELGVPLVPFRTWFSLLQSSQMDTRTTKAERMKLNPAIALIPFLLAADLREHKEPMGQTKLGLQKAVRLVPQLKDVRVKKELVKEWIREWRKIGFLPPKLQENSHEIDENKMYSVAKL